MKRLLRQVAVNVLANPASAALLKPLLRGQATIFMLHRAFHPDHAPDGTTAECIADTVKGLRRAGAQLVSLKHLFDCASQNRIPEPGSVAFTIDDGYHDQGSLAREFLSHDCPVTIFLVSGFIDGKLWPWDEQLAYCVLKSQKARIEIPEMARSFELNSKVERQTAIDELQKFCKTLPSPEVAPFLDRLWATLGINPPASPPPGHQPLSWDEVRELEAAGVDFAPHSVTHRVASQLSDSESREELVTSWNRLTQELVRPVPVYAWPTGRTQDFGTRDVRLAQELGLLGAVATNDWYGKFELKDPNGSREPLFRIERFAFAQQLDINLQYGTAIEQLKHVTKKLLPI